MLTSSVPDVRPGTAASSGPLLATSLVELAVRRLSDAIVGGELAPGERLREEQLSRELGISRAPLREALRLLAQQGLVEHQPRRGARVAELTSGDVEELYDVRDVLEAYALRLALPLRDPRRLDDVRAALAVMRAAARQERWADVATAHRSFHAAVVALAGRRQLLAVYEPILLRTQLYMAANMHREAERSDPTAGVQRHERLLAAVAGDDPEDAVAALRQHGARSYLA